MYHFLWGLLALWHHSVSFMLAHEILLLNWKWNWRHKTPIAIFDFYVTEFTCYWSSIYLIQLPPISWLECIFNYFLDSEQYRDCLDSILRGPISITLRHRLQCHVIRDAAKNEYESEEPILVLNEVTIDRGISSFLANLECYCDHSFVTRVQGDGLILSTTSGSTAYSLGAGGSMVHPQVHRDNIFL